LITWPVMTLGAFLAAETARWHNVIVSGGIKRQ